MVIENILKDTWTLNLKDMPEKEATCGHDNEPAACCLECCAGCCTKCCDVSRAQDIKTVHCDACGKLNPEVIAHNNEHAVFMCTDCLYVKE